jgi:hypothetical protein
MEKGPNKSARYKEVKLAALLLMTVLSQSFLSFVRRNLMTLSFFTTRHKNQ